MEEKQLTASPVAALQMLIEGLERRDRRWSVEMLATCVPSGENATENMLSVCPPYTYCSGALPCGLPTQSSSCSPRTCEES